MERLTLNMVRHAPMRGTAGLCIGQHSLPVELAAALAARQVLDRTGDADGVWTSDLPRCHDLARELAQRIGVPLHVDPRLREISFGEWEGRAWSDIERDDAQRMQVWMADWTRAAPPGGESVPELERRVRAALADVSGEAPLLVGHAGVIRAVRVIAGELDWAHAMREPVPHLEPLRRVV